MSQNDGSELVPLNVKIRSDAKALLKERAAAEQCGLDVYVRAVLFEFLLATQQNPPRLAAFSTVFKTV